MTERKRVTIAGHRFVLAVGNLLSAQADAIVNAANGRLAHGGGVAAAISRAAGPEFDDLSRKYVARFGKVRTGDAAVTGAGNLPFKGVIHAVGPHLGDSDEERLLTSAIANALLRAHERGWRSVAFPAVSSGIFAVPPEVCARAYVAGVRKHFAEHPDSSVDEARLVLFDGPLVALVEQEMDRS